MEYPRLNLTLTCGRRLPLFQQSMRSFMANCLDVDLIDRWLVSDDGSEPHDRELMRREFPFLEIASSPRPGQAASLNALFSRVTSEWFWHTEDDWILIKPGHYIRQCLDIAASDERIRNVTLRHWHNALIQDGDMRYRGHIFNERGSLKTAIEWNNWCWFGYSLNPGLQHKPTVDRIGPYAEIVNRNADTGPAQRYQALGLMTANWPEIVLNHIGDAHSSFDGAGNRKQGNLI